MATHSTKIPPDVLDTLQNARVAGRELHLADQLDRKLYLATAKVLEALGAKWNRKAKCHVFGEAQAAGDVEALIAEVLAAGEYLDAKKVFQAFFTPPAFADELVLLIPQYTLSNPHTCYLEPSAGEGAIVDAIIRACAARNVLPYVKALEVQAKLASKLNGKSGVRAQERDFLNVDPVADVIVMNPPFSGGRDILHVQHAYNCYPATLIAVMSGSFPTRTMQAAVALREQLRRNGAVCYKNPEGTFAPSGTEASTVTIVVNGEPCGPWLNRERIPL